MSWPTALLSKSHSQHTQEGRITGRPASPQKGLMVDPSPQVGTHRFLCSPSSSIENAHVEQKSQPGFLPHRAVFRSQLKPFS